jgi:hypothetical protein
MPKPIRNRAAIGAALIALSAWGCCGELPPPPKPLPPPPEPVAEVEEEPAPEVLGSYAGLDRGEFNRLAAKLDLPLYWYQDGDGNGAAEPGEILALLFHSTEGAWVEDGRFTPAFHQAFGAMLKLKDGGCGGELDPAEAERRALVAEELDQSLPTVVFNDLTALSDEEKTVLGHLLAASRIVDGLFAVQTGAAALEGRLPEGDPASRRMFDRNWGPRCQAPQTESNDKCSAIPGAPEPKVDAYPAALQDEEGFCQSLAGREGGEALLAPFTVARERDGALAAVPITSAYAERMGEVATELEAAAAAISDPAEQALKTYLLAAARAWRDNDWEPADEAWAKMTSTNSKWYLRVAPDETYWDPCNRKAGFHLTLARINASSLALQQKLTAVRQEMEDRLAKLIGKPYAARQVSFQMPDFIDIVTNAGNARSPSGATIGQSLPNWGPVANEGRGRTVAMTNLYTDPDSKAIARAKAEALLDAASLAHYPTHPDADLLGVILHEATHNLGPSHEYAYKGRTDDQAFGGPLATTMEELKAQTGALYYVGFLRRKGIIDDALAKQSYVAAFTWALGHISRGMYTPTGRPKPYSHVSAIHVGFLMDEGAIAFDPKATAANGTDAGAFSLRLDKWERAVEKLMKQVGRIKARNDKRGAQKLIDRYVNDKGKVRQDLIAERVLRHPKATFVYALSH